MGKRKGTKGWQPGVNGMLAPSGSWALQGPEEDAWVGKAGLRSQVQATERGLGVAAGGAGWGGGERGTQSSPPPPPPPFPRVGAPSRALIGAAAAAGRVSAASLRDATPSNCGRDRRYAAASCPGARPGRPRPRPAPRPPAGPPLRLPAERGDTEARPGGPHASRSAGPEAPIRAAAGDGAETTRLASALPLARPHPSRRESQAVLARGSSGGRPTAGLALEPTPRDPQILGQQKASTPEHTLPPDFHNTQSLERQQRRRQEQQQEQQQEQPPPPPADPQPGLRSQSRILGSEPEWEQECSWPRRGAEPSPDPQATPCQHSQCQTSREERLKTPSPLSPSSLHLPGSLGPVPQPQDGVLPA
ncbi:transcription factor Sp7 isoform X3 [Cervus elaphus]|uniref:transcription factor Sp7 isoform X3 n=1 Tax=Cervus elaphus TaxID=9860 RepID=UPI001CC30F01|nr:transcription factor Sp7 isoform X3 [Cervus elaphus]